MDLQHPELRSLLLENTLDILSKLRDHTHMTSAMAKLDATGKQGTVIASLAGDCDHCYVPRVGSHFDLHATAPGKSLLAAQRPDHRGKIIQEIGYKKYTSRTCITPESLSVVLDKISQTGVSIDKGEYVEGINCISSIVNNPEGNPLVAIWITALSIDLPNDMIKDFIHPVLDAAGEMELRIKNVRNDSAAQNSLIIKKAKDFIDSHFHNVTVLQNYFDGLNLSYSWFRKLFKDEFGLGPMQYRQQLLHKQAKRLLINTNLSVKEIAFQLNYDTQNYFSRAFKKHEGLSPQQFREKESK